MMLYMYLRSKAPRAPGPFSPASGLAASGGISRRLRRKDRPAGSHEGWPGASSPSHRLPLPQQPGAGQGCRATGWPRCPRSLMSQWRLGTVLQPGASPRSSQDAVARAGWAAPETPSRGGRRSRRTVIHHDTWYPTRRQPRASDPAPRSTGTKSLCKHPR